MESVWDYPRPPRLERTPARVTVVHAGVTVTDGEHCLRVLETSHPPVYYDLDEMTVNLSTQSKRNSYLKLKLALELGAPEDSETLPNVLPRVVDQFQIYLRGVRVEDLQGSDGLQRLREELLLRAQKAAAPATVKDVLFKVVQIQ
jgi:flagellar basal body-associated protein FliL